MRMRTAAQAVLLSIVFTACGASKPEAKYPVSGADRTGIVQAALDYAEGWYEGNAERMERALHPDMVKRRISGSSCLTVYKVDMVDFAAQGGGTRYPGDKKTNTVDILDVFGDIATVKVISAEYIDYLHVGRVDGEWKIVNVLWAFKDGSGAASTP